MITFNFFSGIFSLYFGFMLVNILVDFLIEKQFIKGSKLKNLILITGYVLILSRLTS
jgi:hypothetical protein